MVLRQLDKPIQKRKLDPYLTPDTKINSEWITGLHIRAKTIKFLQDNIRDSFYDLTFDNGFLDMIPKARSIK